MKPVLISGSNSRNSGGLYNSVRNLGQSMIKVSNGSVDPYLLAHNDSYSALDRDAYNPFKLMDYNIIGPSKLGFSLDIEQKLNTLKPDIMHPQCAWMYLSYKTLQYSKKTNTPYVISPRGMLDKWILNNGSWKKKIAGALYEKEHLKNAACLHALSYSEYQSMRDFGCENPIAIIPNGVTLPIINEDINIDLPKWKSEDERKNLLFLSRLHPKKGIENLLTAWSLLDSEYRKQWKLLIAGETSDELYYSQLEKLIISRNLTEHVFLIGPQFHKNKDNCFRNSDAFILPSFSEGLPMAILEAWSYKLPVIMTQECNIPEGFEHKAAIEITTNPNQILEGIVKLISMDDNDLKQMGDEGYKLVCDKFIWSSIAGQMIDTYDWILNKKQIPNFIKFD